MGTIVLHAGMPKAGSSSIQSWLRSNDRVLADAGWHVVTYRVDPNDGTATVSPARGGGVNSARIVRDYGRSYLRLATLERFFQPLDQLASELGQVIVTGEGFARPFATGDQTFLARLEALASKHRVRVAYYVRAQHESIEAAWRQWGFRQPWSPSEYVDIRANLLDYRKTLWTAAELVPSADFGMRLFHRELLRETDIVTDFSDAFLQPGLTAGRTAVWANPGLPLELVNVLRDAEQGRFWTSAHDNRIIWPLKDLVSRWALPETEEVQHSRAVLQQYCHERFEQDNRSLIAERGWPIRHLVPPVDRWDDATRADPTELDRLWSSRVSRSEREMLFVAIEELLASNAHVTRLDRRGNASSGARPADQRQPVARAAATPATSSDEFPQKPALELVRDREGAVFVVEAAGRRSVASRVVANGLEFTFGPARDVDATELRRWPDAGKVDLVRGRDGDAYVELGGTRWPIRGIPVVRVDNEDVAVPPQGAVIDLGRANVTRTNGAPTRPTRARLPLASSVRRRGIVGTAKIAAKRARGLGGDWWRNLRW